MSGPWPETVLDLAPLGRIAEIQLGKMLQPAPAGEQDGEVAYLRAGLLSSLDSLGDLPRMFASPADQERYAVRPGDLIVAEGGDCGQTGFVPCIPDATIIQNSLHRVRSWTADIRFVRYCLSAIYSSDWLDVLCNKSTFGHLTREKLASIRIPYPSLEEQRAVADYLDSETARIDALTAAKRAMSALIDERTSRAFEDVVTPYGLAFPSVLDVAASDWRLPPNWMLVNLSQVLVQLTNGYVGPTRDILVDEGSDTSSLCTSRTGESTLSVVLTL